MENIYLNECWDPIFCVFLFLELKDPERGGLGECRDFALGTDEENLDGVIETEELLGLTLGDKGRLIVRKLIQCVLDFGGKGAEKKIKVKVVL